MRGGSKVLKDGELKRQDGQGWTVVDTALWLDRPPQKTQLTGPQYPTRD